MQNPPEIPDSFPPAELPLDAFFVGELSPEQAADVRRYLASTPGRQGIVAGILASARGAHVAPPPEADAFLERFSARFGEVFRDVSLEAKAPAIPSQPITRRKARTTLGHVVWRRSLAAVGATLMVVALLAIVVRHGLPRTQSEQITRTYATTTGEQLRVALPDGSQVVLAPQSRLSVAAGFGISARTISLAGQARFVVTTRSAHPFLVRTGTVTTRVLGTTFDIARYADDSAVRVEVLSGKVAIGGGRGWLATLTAGTAGTFTDSTAVATTPSADIDWTHGRLSFVATPVPKALEALERWYNVKFRLGDSTLASRHITAVLDVNEHAETLQILKRVLRVTLIVDDSVIVLMPDRNFLRPSTPSSRKDSAWMFPSTELGK